MDANCNQTDHKILMELRDGKRNVAVNLAQEIDADRSYLNTRLSLLNQFGLIEKVGPADNSGLYEITAAGLDEITIDVE